MVSEHDVARRVTAARRAQPRVAGVPGRGLGGAGAQSQLAQLERQSVLLREFSNRLTERSEEHTSELQSPCNLVCRLLLEKKKKKILNKNHSDSSNSLTTTVTAA